MKYIELCKKFLLKFNKTNIEKNKNKYNHLHKVSKLNNLNLLKIILVLKTAFIKNKNIILTIVHYNYKIQKNKHIYFMISVKIIY